MSVTTRLPLQPKKGIPMIDFAWSKTFSNVLNHKVHPHSFRPTNCGFIKLQPRTTSHVNLCYCQYPNCKPKLQGQFPRGQRWREVTHCQSKDISEKDAWDTRTLNWGFTMGKKGRIMIIIIMFQMEWVTVRSQAVPTLASLTISSCWQ